MTTSEYAVGTIGAVTIGASLFTVFQRLGPKLQVIWTNLFEHFFGIPWF